MGVVERGIRRLIERKGLRHIWVGQQLGMDKQQISRVVRGRTSVKANDLPAYAAVLGVSVLDIYAAGEEDTQ